VPAKVKSHALFVPPNIYSGQTIALGDGGVPNFDREKCIQCGACVWNCAQPLPDNPERTSITFHAGAGGLHSAERKPVGD
jgi:electron-transferring-flavoprotein dehydrogenase